MAPIKGLAARKQPMVGYSRLTAFARCHNGLRIFRLNPEGGTGDC